jgi:hypothetical protein
MVDDDAYILHVNRIIGDYVTNIYPGQWSNKLQRPAKLSVTLVRVLIRYLFVEIVTESEIYCIYEAVILII